MSGIERGNNNNNIDLPITFPPYSVALKALLEFNVESCRHTYATRRKSQEYIRTDGEVDRDR